MGMYKWAPLNPIQSQRGALFLEINTCSFSASTTPTCKFYFCSQTLALVVKTMGMYKWIPLNPLQSQRGGRQIRNRNTYSFLLAPHPQANFTFVQNIGFDGQTMEISKWAPLNPMQQQRGGLYIQKWKYFQPVCQHHTHRQTLFLFSNIGCDNKINGNV